MGIYSKILPKLRSVVVFPFILLVKFYKYFISPILPSACRYYPTCSEYAIEAYKEHGAIKGSWLTTLRLSRCHPLCKREYYDPVPQNKRRLMNNET